MHRLQEAADFLTHLPTRPTLQVLPSMRNDACQLACLSAELRLAALADGACGGCAAAPAVQEVLHSLFALLSEAAPPVVKQANSAGAGGPAAAAPDSSGAAAAQDAAALYLTWLLDATQCAVAYMSSTGAAQVRLARSAVSCSSCLPLHAQYLCLAAADQKSPLPCLPLSPLYRARAMPYCPPWSAAS